MRRLPIPTLVALLLCTGLSAAAWYGYETRPYQDNQRNWLPVGAWTSSFLATLLVLRLVIRIGDR